MRVPILLTLTAALTLSAAAEANPLNPAPGNQAALALAPVCVDPSASNGLVRDRDGPDLLAENGWLIKPDRVAVRRFTGPGISANELIWQTGIAALILHETDATAGDMDCSRAYVWRDRQRTVLARVDSDTVQQMAGENGFGPFRAVRFTTRGRTRDCLIIAQDVEQATVAGRTGSLSLRVFDCGGHRDAERRHNEIALRFSLIR